VGLIEIKEVMGRSGRYRDRARFDGLNPVGIRPVFDGLVRRFVLLAHAVDREVGNAAAHDRELEVLCGEAGDGVGRSGHRDVELHEAPFRAFLQGDLDGLGVAADRGVVPRRHG
jgi:hypothetical protein